MHQLTSSWLDHPRATKPSSNVQTKRKVLLAHEGVESISLQMSGKRSGESQLAYGQPSSRVINAGRVMAGHFRRPLVDLSSGVRLATNINLRLPNAQGKREFAWHSKNLVVGDGDCLEIFGYCPTEVEQIDAFTNICDPGVTKSTFCIWHRHRRRPMAQEAGGFDHVLTRRAGAT